MAAKVQRLQPCRHFARIHLCLRQSEIASILVGIADDQGSPRLDQAHPRSGLAQGSTRKRGWPLRIRCGCGLVTMPRAARPQCPSVSGRLPCPGGHCSLPRAAGPWAVVELWPPSPSQNVLATIAITRTMMNELNTLALLASFILPLSLSVCFFCAGGTMLDRGGSSSATTAVRPSCRAQSSAVSPSSSFASLLAPAARSSCTLAS